ncbi:hypothetical protein H072_6918 [Dactylellina haptotyla CBS 200.50]|uniref:Uncharacterized protein n=1 Tax=Dactylellina haptotyla (strain CBS 200.50) TaxID=1284197 RepID=S8AE08_DACHA|nr:hypothetical protein H072_6918 [Dactylellina haptotyla CBS 200.50]
MRFQISLLVVLHSAAHVWAVPLNDDGDWNKNKALTQITPVGGGEPYWSWEGVIKSMFFDETNSCLSVDIRDNDVQTERYQKVVIRKCPDSRDKAPPEQQWFIKGQIVYDIDNQIIFEGYLRSQLNGPFNSALCLSSHKDPRNTPMYRPGADFANAEYASDVYQDIPPDQDWGKKVLSYQKYITAWGPVYTDICDPNNINQMWQIGLGKSNRQDTPDKWTCLIMTMDLTFARPIKYRIRPKTWGPTICSSISTPWCDGTDHKNCRPNYPFFAGLQRPNVKKSDVDDKFIAAVQAGCSPSYWMFQPNFMALDAHQKPLQSIIKATVSDGRVGPYYTDNDIKVFQAPDVVK